MPKYNITVELIGTDGNAFAILGKVKKAMKAASLTKIQIDEFQNEAMNGDYNHLLQTVTKYVDIE